MIKKGIIYIFLLASACTLGFFIMKNENNVQEQTLEIIQEKEETEEETEQKEATPTIFVDVKGEVNFPGVYEVGSNDRVKDVIEKCGGYTENADTTYINLSKKLQDEMVLYIYTKEQAKQIKENNQDIKSSYIYKNNDALITYEETETKEESTYPVNLNTASKESLMTIPGIGESKADLIIEYRENTPFETIEDIKNIKGIGDATFEKLKNYITV